MNNFLEPAAPWTAEDTMILQRLQNRYNPYKVDAVRMLLDERAERPVGPSVCPVHGCSNHHGKNWTTCSEHHDRGFKVHRYVIASPSRADTTRRRDAPAGDEAMMHIPYTPEDDETTRGLDVETFDVFVVTCPDCGAWYYESFDPERCGVCASKAITVEHETRRR